MNQGAGLHWLASFAMLLQDNDMISGWNVLVIRSLYR